MYHKIRQKAVGIATSLPFGLGDYIVQSEFTRNVIKLSTGSGIVAVCGFLLQPVSARLFSPEDFGLVGLIGSVTGIFAVLIGFNIGPVVIMEKKERDAEATATLQFILGVISIGVIAALFFSFSDYFLNLLKAKEIEPWMPLVFIGLLINALTAPFFGILARRKLFGIQSKISVVTNVLRYTIQITWGLISPSFIGLYLASFLSSFVGLFWGLRYGLFHPIYSYKRLLFVLKRNISFMTYQTITAILCVIFNQLPIIWIVMNLGTAEVGYYTMATVLVDVPIGLMLNSFTQVFYKRIAEAVANEPKQLLSLYYSASKKMLYFGIFIILCILAVSFFIPFILSEKWTPVVPIVQALTIWRMQSIICLPASIYYQLLRRNWMYVILMVFSILLMMIATQFAENSISRFLLVFIFLYTPVHVAYYFIALYFTKKHIENLK